MKHVLSVLLLSVTFGGRATTGGAIAGNSGAYGTAVAASDRSLSQPPIQILPRRPTACLHQTFGSRPARRTARTPRRRDRRQGVHRDNREALPRTYHGLGRDDRQPRDLSVFDVSGVAQNLQRLKAIFERQGHEHRGQHGRVASLKADKNSLLAASLRSPTSAFRSRLIFVAARWFVVTALGSPRVSRRA